MEKQIKIIEAELKQQKKGAVAMIMVPSQLEEEIESAAGGVKAIGGVPIKASPRVGEQDVWLCNASRNILKRVSLVGKTDKSEKPKDPPLNVTAQTDTQPQGDAAPASPDAAGEQSADQAGQQ